MLEVISIATPDYARQWAFCIASHRRYCERLGLAYNLQDGVNADLHPKWHKLQCTWEALSRTEAVMLIDADAEFSPSCPSFAGLLDEHPSADILYANGVSGRLNSGVMIFRGGQDSAANGLLQYCLDHRERPVQAANFVTEEGENGHLIEAMETGGFQERAVVIPSAWNCTVPEGFDQAHIRHYTDRLRNALDLGRLPVRRPAASYMRLWRRLLKRSGLLHRA